MDGTSPDGGLVATYGLQDRLWEIWVKEGSPAVGRRLREVGIGLQYGLSVISLLRCGRQQPVRDGGLCLEADDVLLVGGSREQAQELCGDKQGLILTGPPSEQVEFPSSNAELIEVVVPRGPALSVRPCVS